MPNNCKKVTVQDVIKFFEEEIDGTGKYDGYPRNEGLPYFIRLWNSANICELSEYEFQHLIIPQDPQILVMNKKLEEIEGDDSVLTVEKYFQKLIQGEILPPLIVRNTFPGDLPNSSFYIEDGAHRALSYKKYFSNHPYKSVPAYIGSR